MISGERQSRELGKGPCWRKVGPGGGAGVSRRREQRKKGPGSGRSRVFLSTVEEEVMH